jgi:glycosyltransferase involved in cell wall biosynthesis
MPRQPRQSTDKTQRANGAGATPVVIGHDFMETYGGAERIVAEMAQVFPDAPVVAITGRPEVAQRMGVADRFISLLKPRPALLKNYRLLAPLMPAIVDRFPLPEADVLLTSSYAFAHRMQTANRAPQVCYCYNPLRFAWSMKDDYRATWASNRLAARAFELFAFGMRRSDLRASRRVAHYVTLSEYAARQVSDCYKREAEVIGPPVDTRLFHPSERGAEDYYLFCGRLIEPYKRPTAVVEAFRHLPDRLVVAGDGPELSHLRSIATPNVEFVGLLDDRELVRAMQGCLATIFPSQDDFGLIPVEVAACGRPVIAYAGGGALETVLPGVTGEFITEQTAEAVIAAVRGFDPQAYDPAAIRSHAQRWSSDRFRDAIRDAVARAAN